MEGPLQHKRQWRRGTRQGGSPQLASAPASLPMLLVLLLALLPSAEPVKRGGRIDLVGMEQPSFRSLTAKKPVAQPDYTLYHKQDALLREVTEIVAKSPAIFDMEWRNTTDGDYKADVMIVSVDLGGIESDKSTKTRYLIDFGEHGRELISSELGLHFLRTLADPAAIRAVLGGGPRGEELYRILTEEASFTILPLENMGGRSMVETGQLCERKNGRGVDPNRNWDFDWGVKEKDYSPSEEYPGTRPFSEPEVRVVLDLAKQHSPHVWVNVHSGMEAMFVPWDHKAEIPDDAQEAFAFLSTILKESLTPDLKECVIGSGGKTVGYLAHGTATDYMYQVLKVPIPYTWEIYGDLRAPYDDCFAAFNPITSTQYDITVRAWLKALFRLVELAPTHSVVSAQRLAAKAKAKPSPTQTTKQQPDSTATPPAGQGGGGGDPKPRSPTGSKSTIPGPSGGQGGDGPVVTGVTEGETRPGSGLPAWVFVLFGVGGLAAVALLASRFIQGSASSPTKLYRSPV